MFRDHIEGGGGKVMGINSILAIGVDYIAVDKSSRNNN